MDEDIFKKIRMSAIGGNRDDESIPVAYRDSSEIVSFNKNLRDFVISKQKDIDKINSQCIVPKTWQMYTRMHRQKMILGGDARMRALRAKLLKQDIKHQRSKQQIEFHESFLAACAKHIYGEELSANFLDILADNNWTQIKQEVLICCPRRFGKTYATCLYVAAYAMCIPSHTICIFSPSKRQSEDFLDLVKKFIKEDEIGRTMIYRENKSQLWLMGPEGDTDIRKIKCYPAVVKTLKGVGGEIVICEEAAAMPIQVFYEVVVPLLEMETTACICISTIIGGDNFYTKLLNMVDDLGNPFFVSYLFTLMCDACRLADKEPSECTHLLKELPRWQSGNKHKRIRAMMNQMGQQELLNQETMGITSGSCNAAFRQDSIHFLFDDIKNPRVIPKALTRHVFISIDPNGGGDSRFAIVSVCYEGNNMIILGAEAVAARTPQEYELVLVKHIEKIREHLKHVIIVLLPESNLGFEAAHIYRCIHHYKLLHTVCLKDNHGNAGLKTTNEVKEAMCHRLNEALNNHAITISAMFVNIQSQFIKRDYMNSERILDELKTELLEYEKIIDSDKLNPFKKRKMTFSGKNNGNDDLAVCLQLNIHHTQKFWSDVSYRSWW